MSSNEKRAEFHRGDFADDQNLRPLTIALVTIVVAWLLVYMLGSATKRVEAQADLLENDPPAVMSMVGP